jgi:hypothetical protein
MAYRLPPHFRAPQFLLYFIDVYVPLLRVLFVLFLRILLYED